MRDIHTHINTQARTHPDIHSHMYTHAHTHTRTCTHKHILTHMNIHTFSAKNEDQKLVGCFKDKIFNRLYYTAVLLKIYEEFDQLK